MSKKKSRDKKQWKKIANKRIERLFLLAEKCAHSGRLNLANRYVHIARKISMRYLVPMPREFKLRFCKHCYSYMLPYVSCRVRIQRGRLIIFCFKCGKYMRIPLGDKGRRFIRYA